jgi:hypothetical protein
MVSFILFFSVNLLFCLNVRTVLSVSEMIGQEYNGYGGGKARCVQGLGRAPALKFKQTAARFRFSLG